MDNELLNQLNTLTTGKHTEKDVYVFSVKLCDNEIDKDFECFSDEALEQIKDLCIGKTGILTNNPRYANNTARIFSAYVMTVCDKKTSQENTYKYVKANVYIIRTSLNEQLINEIEFGIKKEISISCCAIGRKCSLCGANLKTRICAHTKGTIYNGNRCYTILDNITDFYEWAFVAEAIQISKLPTTSVFPTIPNCKPTKRQGTCNSCIKEDVCSYKEEFLRAETDIQTIENRDEIFMDNIIRCSKWVNNNINTTNIR